MCNMRKKRIKTGSDSGRSLSPMKLVQDCLSLVVCPSPTEVTSRLVPSDRFLLLGDNGGELH